MKDRVLIVASVASMIDQFNMPNIELLKEMGFDVDVACNFEEGNTCSLERIEELRVRLDTIGASAIQVDFCRSPFKLQNVTAYRQLLALMRDNQYKFVHCHSPIGGLCARIAAHKTGTKVIYTAHGFHFFNGNSAVKNFVFFHIEKMAAQWTDYLIVINKEDYEAALKMLPPERVCLMSGGVGLDLALYGSDVFFEADIDNVRKELGLTAREVLFLMVAEFIPRKRHKDLIDALALTNDTEIHIAFAGTGILFDEICAYAKQRGVASQTHFLGFRRDIPKLMMAVQATILPSAQEGLPRAVMESIVRGVPVIGSDIRGTRDLLIF